MNKNTGIIIGIIVLIVIGGGVYASMNTSTIEMMDKKVDESTMMKKEGDTVSKDEGTKDAEMIKEEETKMVDKGDVMMKVGSYEAYSADKIARAEDEDVVLFFHASWCPSCRGLNTSIENNLKTIPENLTILKVDYDKETELKKKYGVTTQHTLVQVDKDGNLIKKWSGGATLENLLGQIQ